ncbi:MAG TPA: hypothetical protein VMG12_17605 [Polyangiaceae bacterium]|nr:hypothetical protein [Polyangiaceae bacterium]
MGTDRDLRWMEHGLSGPDGARTRALIFAPVRERPGFVHGFSHRASPRCCRLATRAPPRASRRSAAATGWSTPAARERRATRALQRELAAHGATTHLDELLGPASEAS